MGVRGLFTYMQQNRSQLTESILFSKETGPHTLVVDGPSLLYKIHAGLDYLFGGDYDALESVLKRYFRGWKNCGCHVLVVVDGPCPAAKEETRLQRSRDQIQVINEILKRGKSHPRQVILPPLTYYSFMKVLRDCQIPVFVAWEGEGDGLVASLASKHAPAYMLSQDSDYFIFETDCAYVPLDSIEWLNTAGHWSPSVTDSVCQCKALIYRSSRTAKWLQLPVNYLSLYASILGNDYVSGIYDMKSSFHQSSRKVIELLQSLPTATLSETVDSIVQQLGKDREQQLLLSQSIHASLKSYDYKTISNSVPVTALDCFPFAFEHLHYKWMELMKTNRFWCSVQIEDLQRRCSSRIARAWRQKVYSLIPRPNVTLPVTERVRVGKNFTEELVYPVKVLNPFSLNDWVDWNVSTRDDLLIAVLRYFVSQPESKLQRWEVSALVAATIPQIVLPTRYFDFSSQTAHRLAQWQSILFVVQTMLQWTKSDLSLYFNGKRFHVAFSLLESETVNETVLFSSIYDRYIFIMNSVFDKSE